MLPLLVSGRDIEPIVIKKANQFISSEIGDFQLLNLKNLLGGATSLDSILKAYKTSETKGFFPYESFDHPDKMQKTELPRMTLFTVSFVAVTPLKPNAGTILTY